MNRSTSRLLALALVAALPLAAHAESDVVIDATNPLAADLSGLGIDDARIGDGRPGPMTNALLEAYRARVMSAV